MPNQKSNSGINSLNRQKDPLPEILFKPCVVLTVSLVAAGLFILLMLPLPRFSGERRWYLWAYHAPVVAIFISYCFDRIEHRSRMNRPQWIIESLVVSLALIRAIFSIPYISGHALFLSYILTTASFRLVWWLALLMAFEVVYLKIFVLEDPTLIGGAIAGILAGILTLKLGLFRKGKEIPPGPK